MNFSKFVFAALAGSFFLNSCSSDDNTNNSYTPLGKYDSGLLVLNQGGFGHGDAALSYVSYDYSTLENDIFSLNNNGLPLGDTAQDIGLKGSSAYIVVNGSNKIEVVNRYTMAHIATIDSGLSNPRYIAFTDQNKAYVTNWGDGLNADDDYVAIIDLASNLVTGTIQVSEGPERIIEYGGRLYVTHIGGFGFGNSISVINFATSSVSSIPVGDVPTGLYADNNVLWVSCAGKPSYAPEETPGGLVKINLTTNSVVSSYFYSDVTKHISNFAIENGAAYYTVGAGVYKFDLSSNALPGTPAFTTTAQGVSSVYSLAVFQNHIYVGDAGDFTNNGHVYIYATGTGFEPPAIGTLQKSLAVGVAPAGFYFNF